MLQLHRTHALPAVTCLLFLAGCGPLGPDGEEMRFRSGGDLIAGGAVVDVPESVDGDVMAAGRAIVFTGSSGGSFLGVGTTQELQGSIAGSMRAAGGRIVATGRTERNVTLLGADVVLDGGAQVGLNAYLVGGRVEQRGTVAGHLRAAGRDVILDGPVTGNVDVIARSLTLGPSARIEGDLSYRVREGGIVIDPASSVAGDVAAVTVPGPSLAFRILIGTGRAAAFLLVGSILLLVVPPLRRAASQLDDRALPALGLGLLWLVAIPVMTAAAFVTVIGIPLAFIAGILYLMALYLAPVLPGLWLGRSLLDRPGAPPTPAVRAFLLGGAVLAVAMLMPWLGFPIRLLAVAFGFGCVVLAVRASLADSPTADGG
ncbi:MAG: polymer-forming cytoskeletal protein [Gemmatimonadota bacterium]